MTTDKTPAPMPAKLSSGPLQDGTAGSGATPTTDKTDAELIADMKHLAKLQYQYHSAHVPAALERGAARIAELAQERADAINDTVTMGQRAEKAEAALAASAKDAAQLRSIISDHNESCRSACAARGDSCIAYTGRGKMCPDCPQDWAIDAAFAQTEERIDQAAAQAQIDHLGFCSQQQTEGLGK